MDAKSTSWLGVARSVVPARPLRASNLLDGLRVVIQREIESGTRQDLRARERLVNDLLPTRGQANSVVQALRFVYERKEAIANMAEWTVKVARRLALAAAGAGLTTQARRARTGEDFAVTPSRS